MSYPEALVEIMARPLTTVLCVNMPGPRGWPFALVLAALAGAACALHGSGFVAVKKGAATERISTPQFTVDQIELGAATVGQNRFSARVVNLTPTPIALGLDLRAIPGMWFGRPWQHQFSFEIPPGRQQIVSAEYVFETVSPEAILRVRFGPTAATSDGIRLTQIAVERRYAVGAENPAATQLLRKFVTFRSTHFEIFADRQSPASHQLAQIAAEREAALAKLLSLVPRPSPARIQLVLYNDLETKQADTHHQGAGLAYDHTIVEVWNKDLHLDPYHELAHILTASIGDPPALFNEGFATYVAERFGSAALSHLQSSASTDQIVCRLKDSRELIPMAVLLRFNEIGSAESHPSVAYPQSASIVRYLIERWGSSTFFDAFAKLQSTDIPAGHARNSLEFERIFGLNSHDVEEGWLSSLGCPVGHTR